MRKRVLAFFVFALTCVGLCQTIAAQTQTNHAKGEEAYMKNKPLVAIPALEAALREEPKNEQLYLYLGICYQQVGKLDSAVAVLRKGQDISTLYPYIFANNLGNCYYTLGKNAFAEEMYKQAIAFKPDYAPAVLGHAQALVNLKRYDEASADYQTYLELFPDTPQRPAIEQFIARIKIAKDDEERIAAAKAAEAAAQAARQKQLLDEVNESLKQAAAETQGTSAGTEGAQDYDDEASLAD
jgi:tetratricopeptide (TPR) repeat protein